MVQVRSMLVIAFIPFAVALPGLVFAQEQPGIEQDADALFPSQVSPQPGIPKKTLIQRPGDRNVSNNPAPRYRQPDSIRSGNPKSLSLWSSPSVNSKYSAAYAGGSALQISPSSRPRRHHEGTWGLDFTLWSNPKLAWLRWSDGSQRQSNGNFETDR